MTSDNQPRLFVTGATGQLGRLVIRELLKRVPASSVVAGVRSPDHDVARPQRTHLRRKFPHNFNPVHQGRTSVAGQPQSLQARKQRAESVFGVGLADRAMGAEVQPWGLGNFPQIPVTGKQVHPAAEFSAEGLGISERGLADCGATDVMHRITLLCGA